MSLNDEPAHEVGAGQYLLWQWQPSNYQSCHVEGRIVGLAGGSKDIEVFLFDEDGYLNWKNNHPAKTYFQSGRQTATSLDLIVDGSRKYVLVISNSFSVLTAKTIQITGVKATCED